MGVEGDAEFSLHHLPPPSDFDHMLEPRGFAAEAAGTRLEALLFEPGPEDGGGEHIHTHNRKGALGGPRRRRPPPRPSCSGDLDVVGEPDLFKPVDEQDLVAVLDPVARGGFGHDDVGAH